jgi:hypothetical protein
MILDTDTIMKQFEDKKYVDFNISYHKSTDKNWVIDISYKVELYFEWVKDYSWWRDTFTFKTRNELQASSS